MRIPQKSNPRPSAAPNAGTMGGQSTQGGGSPIGANPRRVNLSTNISLGDEKYLWFLVAAEIATLCCLRKHFRRHHGG